MDGILKVTPTELKTASSEFGAKGGQVKGLTGEMMNLVNGLNSVWQGEAATAFSNKFKELQDDMDKIYNMIQEHSKDLTEMAQRYEAAEKENDQTAQALKGDAIS